MLDGIKVAFVFQEGLLRTDATSAVRGNVEVCRCRYHAHLPGGLRLFERMKWG